MRSAGIFIACITIIASAHASPKSGKKPPANLDLFFTAPPAVIDSTRAIAKTMLERIYQTGLFSKRTCAIYVLHDTIQVRLFHNTRPIIELRALLETRGQLRLYESNDSMYNLRTDSSWAPSGYIPLKDKANVWHYVQLKTLDAALTEVDTRIEEFDNYMIYADLALNQMEPKSVSMKGTKFLVATIDNIIYACSYIPANLEEKARVLLASGISMSQAYILGQALNIPYAYPVTYIGGRELKPSAHWLLPGKNGK